jgi:hypothetical protein
MGAPMAHRPRSFVLLLWLGACAADSEPTATATCEDAIAHAAGLRAEARLEHVPASELDGHRAAMSAALVPTLSAACARMSEAERACWQAARAVEELDRCAPVTAEDATALANAPHTPFAMEP